jgi:hypothetical protein
MTCIDDLPKTTFAGRRFTRKQLRQVQETVGSLPNLSRTELARTVCEHLDWRTPGGKLKVNSGAGLLCWLESEGVLQLPPKRTRSQRPPVAPTRRTDGTPPEIAADLTSLTPVSLERVVSAEARLEWKAFLAEHHYLGYSHPFGAHLGYLIVSEATQQRLGCLVFAGSAAWALAPRDEWIGWDTKTRRRLLHLVVNQSRFLILPWVKVPNLASHVLSLAARQLPEDWLHEYGYRPVLLETFVDTSRFSGGCYRASNWLHLGQTQGRGRDDTAHDNHKTPKEVFVLPLRSDWQQILTCGSGSRALKKRYRNDLRAATRPVVDDGFVGLWGRVAHILHDVAADYDGKWRVRKRLIDSFLLMMLIFRLVTSKNSQSYGSTIDELWESCGSLGITLPQRESIAASSFCSARRKLDEGIFKTINSRIINAAADAKGAEDLLWLGHRLFAVDGSKLNLPRALLQEGYALPCAGLHYPQGLLSCLYALKLQVPFDFELSSHADERLSAVQHLRVLQPDDVVVYDRGYFSLALLYQHQSRGVHAIFRLQSNAWPAVTSFLASAETDSIIEMPLSYRVQRRIALDSGATATKMSMRCVKYAIKGVTFCLGTTLRDADTYSIAALADVYHARWGIEELYKTSKRTIGLEDFHAKTERGVKQEVYAHFALITMARLFANSSDTLLNDFSKRPEGSSAGKAAPFARVKTNFKNCLHVLARSFEQLLMMPESAWRAVQSAFAFIAERSQRVRAGRSYPRRSMRPRSQWRAHGKRRDKPPAALPAGSPAKTTA